MVEKNKEKAEEFIKYFSAMNTLDTTNAPIIPEIEEPQETLSTIRIAALSVQEIFPNLNPNKANGPDQINPRMLKEMASSISSSLGRIFNKSINLDAFISEDLEIGPQIQVRTSEYRCYVWSWTSLL